MSNEQTFTNRDLVAFLERRADAASDLAWAALERTRRALNDAEHALRKADAGEPHVREHAGALDLSPVVAALEARHLAAASAKTERPSRVLDTREALFLSEVVQAAAHERPVRYAAVDGVAAYEGTARFLSADGVTDGLGGTDLRDGYLVVETSNGPSCWLVKHLYAAWNDGAFVVD